MLLSAEPSPELVREKVGGLSDVGSPLLNTMTTLPMALVTAGDSEGGVDVK